MTEQKKPKIILVYGVHLNESAVAEYLTKQLEPLLKARGFDIEILPFPKDLTLQELAKTIKPDELYNKVYSIWDTWINQISKTCDFVIDVHNANPKDLTFKDFSLRKPKFWPTRVIDFSKKQYDKYDPLSIRYNQQYENLFVLEMPIIHKPARQEWQKFKSLSDWYFGVEADLPATIKAGYLSPQVIAKFAHLIDTTIKTKLKIYHSPRTLPFKPKSDKYMEFMKGMTKKLRREQMRPR